MHHKYVIEIDIRFLANVRFIYVLISGLLVGQQQTVNEETEFVGTSAFSAFAEYDRYQKCWLESVGQSNARQRQVAAKERT